MFKRIAPLTKRDFFKLEALTSCNAKTTEEFVFQKSIFRHFFRPLPWLSPDHDLFGTNGKVSFRDLNETLYFGSCQALLIVPVHTFLL